MTARRWLVEHPLGTMKSWTSLNHFLTKRLSGVSIETSLQIQTDNMKRAINLVQTKKTMEATARKRALVSKTISLDIAD